MKAGEIHKRQELELQTPLTARQAFAAILPSVGEIDATFKFVSAGSSEDIDHLGRASTWHFEFTFSRIRAWASLAVEPCSGIEADGPSAACIDIHVQPMNTQFVSRGGQTAKPSLGLVKLLERSWDKQERARVALPFEFRDSPEAVIALAEQGVDWIAGGIHMTLSSQVLPDGHIVWQTDYQHQAFRTPFGMLGT